MYRIFIGIDNEFKLVERVKTNGGLGAFNFGILTWSSGVYNGTVFCYMCFYSSRIFIVYVSFMYLVFWHC